MSSYVNIYLENRFSKEKMILRVYDMVQEDSEMYYCLDSYFYSNYDDTLKHDAKDENGIILYPLNEMNIRAIINDLKVEIEHLKTSISKKQIAKEKLFNKIIDSAVKQALNEKDEKKINTKFSIIKKNILTQLSSDEEDLDEEDFGEKDEEAFLERLTSTLEELKWYQDLIFSFNDDTFDNDFSAIWCSFEDDEDGLYEDDYDINVD